MLRPGKWVILFYKSGKPIADWITKYKISYDGCRNWSDAKELVPYDRSGGRGPVCNKSIYLEDGTILAPGFTEQGEWKYRMIMEKHFRF